MPSSPSAKARDGVEVGHVCDLPQSQCVYLSLARKRAVGRTGLIYDEKNPRTNYHNTPLATRDSPLYGRVGPMGYQYRNDKTRLPAPALPDERYGLLMVFRVFDRASYALIMNADRQVHVLDIATNP